MAEGSTLPGGGSPRQALHPIRVVEGLEYCRKLKVLSLASNLIETVHGRLDGRPGPPPKGVGDDVQNGRPGRLDAWDAVPGMMCLCCRAQRGSPGCSKSFVLFFFMFFFT